MKGEIIMAYTKKTWVKGNTPLSAENFNHMEQGIADAHTDIAQLNSDLKNAFVTQYAELNGTGNNYFYVDRKQGYRLSSAILHVYDTGYIRVEAISQEVNNENCYVLWTNNSYPQNQKIGCDLVWIKENFLWN
mgnify:CR=1 FL=1|jgi:hypothetical protein